jgi:2'-hydroxyisoflavone reductase
MTLRQEEQNKGTTMTTTRRTFIGTTTAAAGALSLGLHRGLLAAERPVEQAAKSLNILILGGTTYLGPYQIKYALERGHKISIFNRGKTVPTLYPELFDQVEKLKGDRENDLESLKGREWDAVIDNSATNPEWVHDTAQLLKDNVGHYLYTSSTGAFYPYLTHNIDESVEVVLEHDPEAGGAGTYGVNKSLSEVEVREAFPGRDIIIRPHYIIGPGDPSDRLTYWVARIDAGGETLMPGDPNTQVQLIDVRDLTEWMIRMVEGETTGTFIATGPASRLSTAELAYGIRSIVSNEISFTWVERDFLIANGLQYMVPWIPPVDDLLGMNTINPGKAIAHGLTYRPLAVTAKDNLDWWKVQPEERRERMGELPNEKEIEVLAAWHAREK